MLQTVRTQSLKDYEYTSEYEWWWIEVAENEWEYHPCWWSYRYTSPNMVKVQIQRKSHPVHIPQNVYVQGSSRVLTQKCHVSSARFWGTVLLGILLNRVLMKVNFSDMSLWQFYLPIQGARELAQFFFKYPFSTLKVRLES